MKEVQKKSRKGKNACSVKLRKRYGTMAQYLLINVAHFSYQNKIIWCLYMCNLFLPVRFSNLLFAHICCKIVHIMF